MYWLIVFFAHLIMTGACVYYMWLIVRIFGTFYVLGMALMSKINCAPEWMKCLLNFVCNIYIFIDNLFSLGPVLTICPVHWNSKQTSYSCLITTFWIQRWVDFRSQFAVSKSHGFIPLLNCQFWWNYNVSSNIKSSVRTALQSLDSEHKQDALNKLFRTDEC